MDFFLVADKNSTPGQENRILEKMVSENEAKKSIEEGIAQLNSEEFLKLILRSKRKKTPRGLLLILQKIFLG